MTAESAASSASFSSTLIGRLFEHAAERADHPAIATTDVSITYARLARLVVAQASLLQQTGVVRGSTVGIRCDDEISHLLLCLAAIYCGATSCTIPSHESDTQQNALIERCGATRVLERRDVPDFGQLDELLPKAPASESQASILFSTSGTTGAPKLVIHGDGDLVAQAHRHIGDEQERFACLASIEHNFAKRHRLYCVAMGATNVFPGTLGNSLVERCLSLQVNVLHVSAFQAQELLALDGIGRLCGLRLKLGGSHVGSSLRQQLRAKITAQLQAGYGTTETGAIAFTDPADDDAGISVGLALPGIEICAVDSDRKPLPADERGELAVRCGGMFRGYLDNPELTATRLDNGWFYTGDIGFLDSKGRIHISGRSDDMFVFNSMNIYPQDIESVIREHPGVREAVVLPRESSVHGNIPVALVVLGGSAKKQLPALKKFVKKRVGVRAPRQYIVVDTIPTNASGKIARREAVTIPGRNDQLRADLIRIIDPKVKQRVKPALLRGFVQGKADVALRRFEMDSLERLELLLTLETGYNIVVPPAIFNSFRYLGDLVAHILSPESGCENEDNQQAEALTEQAVATDFGAPVGKVPGVVCLFRRVFRVSPAIVQLNKALMTLENRLTPREVMQLTEWHASGHLLPEGAEERRRAIVSRWLRGMRSLLEKSNKTAPEPFVSRRVVPTARLFTGPGSPEDKTLMICFPPSGGRNLMMSNTVFLQHVDASRVDVLMLSETLNRKYRNGIPFIGRNLKEIVLWLAGQHWIKDYRDIVTIGCSAGAPLALTVAGQLNASVGLSVCGRFYRKRHLLANLSRAVSIYRARRNMRSLRMIYAYGVDDARDRMFAELMAPFSSGEKLPVAFSDRSVGHEILGQLLDRGELREFLERTVLEFPSESVATMAPRI
ncbi:MAG: hypothetical protein CMN85_11255 [Spongiibacteraceae bacterium]|nr:hypothetical protein [Spongiibacteraceae bacterium]